MYFKRFWLMVCVVLTFSMVSHADEKKQSLSLVTALSPPYAYFGDDGQLHGIIIDMVDLMNQNSTYKVSIYHVPPPRIYKELAEGYADLSILPGGKNADSVADRVVKLSRSPVVLASLKRNEITIDSLDDLARKRLGYVKGISYGVKLDQIPDLYKVPLLSTDVGIEMLLRGRIDYILSSERTLAYHLIAQRIRDNVVKRYEVRNQSAYLYVSKTSENKSEIKDDFAKIVAKLNKKGKLKQTYQHFTLSK